MEFKKFDPYASYIPWNKWCLTASLSLVGYMAAQRILSFFGTTTPWHLRIPGLAVILIAQYISIMRPPWSLARQVLVVLAVGLATGFVTRLLSNYM